MTKTTFLNFEQPVAELESKIEELRFVQDDSAVDISEEIDRLAKKSQQLTKDIYAKLTPWQVSQIARHPQRPYTMDYVNAIFTDFHELHGDRSFADDQSIIGGLARFNGQPCMVELKVPLIATIIGEGGSGGALAIAVGDAVLMLQYATYSVISPEGCASILWKTSERASDAADALGLTAHRLKAIGLIDKIVNEPLGGAHRDPQQMAQLLKRALADTLRQFQGMKTKDLLDARHAKLMAYGKFKETLPREE
jgi:acetyl-CoA carboxylase alpha subunit